eukprot:2758659-Amphidinium_carterae.1
MQRKGCARLATMVFTAPHFANLGLVAEVTLQLGRLRCVSSRLARSGQLADFCGVPSQILDSLFILVAKVRSEEQQTVWLMVSTDGAKTFKAPLLLIASSEAVRYEPLCCALMRRVVEESAFQKDILGLRLSHIGFVCVRASTAEPTQSNETSQGNSTKTIQCFCEGAKALEVVICPNDLVACKVQALHPSLHQEDARNANEGKNVSMHLCFETGLLNVCGMLLVPSLAYDVQLLVCKMNMQSACSHRARMRHRAHSLRLVAWLLLGLRFIARRIVAGIKPVKLPSNPKSPTGHGQSI